MIADKPERRTRVLLSWDKQADRQWVTEKEKKEGTS